MLQQFTIVNCCHTCPNLKQLQRDGKLNVKKMKVVVYALLCCVYFHLQYFCALALF